MSAYTGANLETKWEERSSRKPKKDIPRSGTGRYYNIKEYEEKQRMEQQIDITFYLQDLNFVIKALGGMSYAQAAPLIQNIQQQVKAQQDLQSESAIEGQFESVPEEESVKTEDDEGC